MPRGLGRQGARPHHGGRRHHCQGRRGRRRPEPRRLQRAPRGGVAPPLVRSVARGGRGGGRARRLALARRVPASAEGADRARPDDVGPGGGEEKGDGHPGAQGEVRAAAVGARAPQARREARAADAARGRAPSARRPADRGGGPAGRGAAPAAGGGARAARRAGATRGEAVGRGAAEESVKAQPDPRHRGAAAEGWRGGAHQRLPARRRHWLAVRRVDPLGAGGSLGAAGATEARGHRERPAPPRGPPAGRDARQAGSGRRQVGREVPRAQATAQ